MVVKNKLELLETKATWVNKYNIVYPVIIVLMFLMFGVSNGILFAGVVCIGAFLVQQEIAKNLSYAIRKIQFSLPSKMTREEIVQKVYHDLLNEKIETNFENDELSFKSQCAIYEFIWNEKTQSFTLRWGFSIGKAFFHVTYITDYKTLLKETGTIAFMIQQ